MAGGSNGCRAALVRRQLTPGLISSLPGTAGLPPFISFSTNYPELDHSECPQHSDGRRDGHTAMLLSDAVGLAVQVEDRCRFRKLYPIDSRSAANQNMIAA
jgi:hypothetical protein